MKNLVFALLVITLRPSFAFAGNDAIFDHLRNKLNYNDPSIAAQIPRFESGMVALAVRNLRKLRFESKDQADLALSLIYTALYMTNTNNWVEFGGMTYGQLISYRRFSMRADVHSELVAREKFIVKLISTAKVYLPNDRRVESWLAGADMALERYETGTISAKTISSMMKAATDYPNFNLFTAILASREVKMTDDDHAQLLRLTLEMIGPNNPCRTSDGDDPVCVNGWKAPFNFQTAVALLGDVLVKQAESEILGTDATKYSEGYKLAYTAIGVYSSAFADKTKESTAKWVNRDALQERIDRANLLISEKKSLGDFWKTANGRTMYQCSSCHSGSMSLAGARGAFHASIW